MTKALHALSTNTTKNHIQRVDAPPPSEGGHPIQRVANAPPVTTSINPKAPGTPKAKPHMYLQKTKNNMLEAVSPIEVFTITAVTCRSLCLNQSPTCIVSHLLGSILCHKRQSASLLTKCTNTSQCFMDTPVISGIKSNKSHSQL